jgi:hypothetical protein
MILEPTNDTSRLQFEVLFKDARPKLQALGLHLLEPEIVGLTCRRAKTKRFWLASSQIVNLAFSLFLHDLSFDSSTFKHFHFVCYLTKNGKMSKEATVYVLDLGATMGECHSGRVETDLQYAMRYVYHKMADNMSSTRTTLSTGVIGFRTDGTANPSDTEEGYENITVLQPLGPLSMAQFNELRANIVPSETEAGDAISAVVVAVQIMEQFTTLKSGKLGSFIRNITLVTDGQGRIDDELLDVSLFRLSNHSGVRGFLMRMIIYTISRTWNPYVQYDLQHSPHRECFTHRAPVLMSYRILLPRSSR